ncbi:MAG: glycosyltransferase [Deltaproteobacteria bacterium]|nr:MAG: glycosyltransferase [Deltaproteobacteria bacterium]
MARPVISVVTLTWNSARFVDPLLDTLLADARASDVPIEVIAVDNGSTDDTVERLARHRDRHPEVQLVPLSRNHGTTVSRNIGIRMARGDYVLVLDSDTEIPPGTLRGLVDAPARIPDPDRVGIICPRLVYPDGGFQESARRFPTVLTKVYRLLDIERLRARNESIDAVLAGETTPVDYAISACWLVPRTTFDRVGLLDETIFYSPEDVEFCARCWRAGLAVWYYPAVQVVHNCQRITNKRPLSRMGLSHAKGLVRYWWRYRAFWSPPRGIHREPDRG